MEMEGSEESEGEAIEVELVEEYRNKLLNNQTFQQLSLFHWYPYPLYFNS